MSELRDEQLEVMLETLRHPATEQEPRRMQLYEDRIELLIAALRSERKAAGRLRDVLTALVVECRPDEMLNGTCAPDLGVWMTAREELLNPAVLDGESTP